MRKFLLLLFLLAGYVLPAQHIPDWVSSYGGPAGNISIFAGIAKDNAGNVYMVSGGGSDGAFLVKYNGSGIEQWARIIKLGIFDLPRDVVTDSFGNVYVAGFRENLTGTFDYTLSKYTSGGDSIWARIYNGLNPTAMDETYAMAVDKNNNIYVTGYSHGSTPSGDFLTIKYNADGDSLWVARFNAGGFNRASSIRVDDAGNVYVAGSGQGSGTGWAIVVKYNSSGALQWSVNSSMFPIPSKKLLAIDKQGNSYAGGYVINPGSLSDFNIIKINPSGSIVWTRTFNVADSNRVDELKALVTDNSGNVIAVGQSFKSGYITSTVKYSPDGVKLWDRIYSNSSSTIPFDIACNEDGNIFISGGSVPFIVEYAPSGDSIRVVNYFHGNNGNNNIQNIIIDNNSEVYGAGRMRAGATGSIFNVVTLKYSDFPTGIFTASGNAAGEYTLYQNYPNPFNPVTNIKYSLQNSTEVKLIVYDIAGKEAAVFDRGVQNPGAYSITFNGSSLSSGVYYYRIITSEFTDTKKMLLIK